MAFSFNQIMLVGNVSREPEMRYTPKGTANTVFSMATNRRRKDDTAQGGYSDEVTFHRIVVWGKTAEWISQSLHKGDRVMVVGRQENRKYTDKNNVDHYMSEVVAETIIPPNKPRGNQPSRQEEAGPEPDTTGSKEEVDTNDIPF